MIRLTDPARFGVALRSMQAATGITTTELATRVGCTRSHLSNLRWGGFVPSYELLIQLADALGHDLALIPREDT